MNLAYLNMFQYISSKDQSWKEELQPYKKTQSAFSLALISLISWSLSPNKSALELVVGVHESYVFAEHKKMKGKVN